MFIFPLIASFVSFIFAGLLIKQYLERKKPYQLAWGISLALFGIGAAAETIATVQTWDELLVKIYYIFGGTLIVGVLGLGSLYVSGDHDAGSPTATFLLGRRFNTLISTSLTFLLWLMIYGLAKNMFANNINVALLITALHVSLIITALFFKDKVPQVFLAVLLIGGILAASAVWSSGIDPLKLSEIQGWHALNRTLGIRSAAFGFNVIGSFIVIIGAVQSAISLYRKNILRDKAMANILIALGVLIVASGGTFGGLLGLGGQAAISIPMAFGVIVMFIGFLQASRPPKTVPQPKVVPTT